jgi:hypothetical protein
MERHFEGIKAMEQFHFVKVNLHFFGSFPFGYRIGQKSD